MPFLPPSRRAVTPGGRGRFDGFDVLSEVDRWDDVTAGVVLSRLDPPPDYSFFTPAEQATADVLRLVDQRLALDMTDGWFYEDMPEDADAWRVTLAALDDEAQQKHQAPFHVLDRAEQAALLQAVADAEVWHGLNGGHVWSLWTRYACAAFYSHPWAWNEMGFDGPAYPRGYKNIGVGRRERRETPDGIDRDPVDWGERVGQARRAHETLTQPSDGPQRGKSQGTRRG
jgi:Gluconate 2-dehydrogenase subunit 3